MNEVSQAPGCVTCNPLRLIRFPPSCFLCRSLNGNGSANGHISIPNTSSGPTDTSESVIADTVSLKIGTSSDALDEVFAEAYSYIVDGVVPSDPLMKVLCYTAKQIVRQGQTD